MLYVKSYTIISKKSPFYYHFDNKHTNVDIFQVFYMIYEYDTDTLDTRICVTSKVGDVLYVKNKNFE